MHEAPNGKMGHDQTVKLLSDQVGGFAPERDLAAAQVRF